MIPVEEWIGLGIITLILCAYFIIAFSKGRDSVHPIDRMLGLIDTSYGVAVPARILEADVESKHLFRLYLDGSNQDGDCWSVNVETPPSKLIDAARWKLFSHRELGPVFDCSNDRSILIRVLSVLYPPLCSWMLYEQRLGRATNVAKAIVVKGSSLWADSHARAVGDSLAARFGCDASSATVGWIDVLDLQRPPPDGEVGETQEVYVFRYAGIGSYLFPYTVDTTDALFSKHVDRLDVPTEWCPVMERSTPRRTGSSCRGSYTTLQDALVESSPGLLPQHREYCTISPEMPGPRPGCRYVIGSRLSPLGSGACIREEQVQENQVIQETSLWHLVSGSRKFLFTDIVPSFTVCRGSVSYWALSGLICIQLCLLIYIRTLTLHGLTDLHWVFPLLNLTLPPMANEASMSCIMLSVLNDVNYGRWAVALLLCSLPADLLSWCMMGNLWVALGVGVLKLLLILEMNKLIFSNARGSQSHALA